MLPPASHRTPAFGSGQRARALNNVRTKRPSTEILQAIETLKENYAYEGPTDSVGNR